ncbi:MAG TPA: hypothetical protein VHS54_10105 [Jatrophihabitans sp.]|nr:hypothetical protein [Jatrophihabitans sp.]
MTADLLVLYCPTCARECFAEAPPCPDGHAGACPDRACVECGTALLLDAPLFALADPPRRRQAA